MIPSKPLKVLREQTNWEKLYFYQKTVVLYQMTYVFCKRFLPKHGDRTVDQMVQAARSGKQNIVEGCADGVTSTEMELKLLNVARASIKELKEDYLDYIRSRSLTLWNAKHPRYDGLLNFCRTHNALEDYEPFFDKWTDEERNNGAIPVFENSTANFGIVKAGDPVEVTFNCSNRGKSTFHIYQADPEDSALKVLEITDCEPGGKGLVRVSLNTSAVEKGEAVIMLTLTTNSPLRPVVNLFVAGEIH